MPGRAAVGPRSGGGRPLENTRLGPVEAAFQPGDSKSAENAKGRENPDFGPVVPYSPVPTHHHDAYSRERALMGRPRQHRAPTDSDLWPLMRAYLDLSLIHI